MSKAQMIEEILRCSPDVRNYEYEQALMNGLDGANMVSLEWVRDQLKASRNQQNKQTNNTNKNEMK